jgi:hypothetical protein
MATWDHYPHDYRSAEIAAIRRAAQAGDCVAVVGLSGAGKSNLLGFLANRVTAAPVEFLLVDGNRLTQPNTAGFMALMGRTLGGGDTAAGATLVELETAIGRRLAERAGAILCFALDLSTLTSRVEAPGGEAWAGLYSNLRALRDAHKYRLTYVAATRHTLPADNELAELFFGRQVWLGPLAESDARWTVEHYAARQGLAWANETVTRLIELSGGYPALLRAGCEAHAAGAALEVAALARHPAVQGRVQEFWADKPSEDELKAARLDKIELLNLGRTPRFDTNQLTAKENLLLGYLTARPEQVCSKDDLVRAVWPEDRVYERGVRDDSLAQLVRRLREKIEPDPATPRYVHTVAGRGYRFSAGPG